MTNYKVLSCRDEEHDNYMTQAINYCFVLFQLGKSKKLLTSVLQIR